MAGSTQLPNSGNAFPPSQGPSTGPNEQVEYMELPNQDTVALTPGMLVQLKVTNNIVGCTRAVHAATAGPLGIVTNSPGVGQIATIAVEGVVQAIADAAITAGDWLVGPTTTDGRVGDGAIANSATTGALSGLVVGFAITAQANAGSKFWMYVEKM